MATPWTTVVTPCASRAPPPRSGIHRGPAIPPGLDAPGELDAADLGAAGEPDAADAEAAGVPDRGGAPPVAVPTPPPAVPSTVRAPDTDRARRTASLSSSESAPSDRPAETVLA